VSCQKDLGREEAKSKIISQLILPEKQTRNFETKLAIGVGSFWTVDGVIQQNDDIHKSYENMIHQSYSPKYSSYNQQVDLKININY